MAMTSPPLGPESLEQTLTDSLQRLCRHLAIQHQSVDDEAAQEASESVVVCAEINEVLEDGVYEIRVNAAVLDLPEVAVRKTLTIFSVKTMRTGMRELLHAVLSEIRRAVEFHLEPALLLKLVGMTNERRRQQGN